MLWPDYDLIEALAHAMETSKARKAWLISLGIVVIGCVIAGIVLRQIWPVLIGLAIVAGVLLWAHFISEIESPMDFGPPPKRRKGRK